MRALDEKKSVIELRRDSAWLLAHYVPHRAPRGGTPQEQPLLMVLAEPLLWLLVQLLQLLMVLAQAQPLLHHRSRQVLRVGEVGR